MTRQAAIYVRISAGSRTRAGTPLNLEDELARCRATARLLGYAVGSQAHDRQERPSDPARKRAEILGLWQAGTFEALVVPSYAHLSGSVDRLVTLLRLFHTKAEETDGLHLHEADAFREPWIGIDEHLLERLHTARTEWHAEATRAALVHAKTGPKGQRRAWDDVAIARMYAQKVAVREIARRLSTPDVRVPPSSLHAHIQRLREQGALIEPTQNPSEALP